MTKGKLKFYFTFRSPFACIAYYRLRRAPQFNDVDIQLIPLWPKVTFGGHMDDPAASIFKMAYIFQDAGRQAEIAGLRAEFFHQYNTMLRDRLLKPGTDLKTKKLGAVPLLEPALVLGVHDPIHARRRRSGQAHADVPLVLLLGEHAVRVGM